MSNVTEHPLTATTPAVSPAPGAVPVPRPEHPRPDFQRQPWINLNGHWRFTFDPDNVGEQLRWHRLPHPHLHGPRETGSSDGASGMVLTEDPYGAEIVVPFPWESRLSGVNDPKYKGAAWYQRIIETPADWAVGDTPSSLPDAGGLPSVEDTATSTTIAGVTWRLRPFLCFGAVDWHARVWVNGRFAAEHAGGYTPFAIDLSRFLRPGRPATLTVRVWDASDADTPTGKQTPRWYTPSSGIWQTVWLEGRPSVYLQGMRITPHLERGSATFDLTIEAPPGLAGQERRVTVRAAGGAFPDASETLALAGGRTDARLEVDVPTPHAWSPEDPHLYECTVTLSPELTRKGEAGHAEGRDAAPAAVEDQVSTYFGLRSVARGRWEGKPYEYVFLNGEPVYLRGALDQAFHPDGLHAYPSDDAIRADVQAAKDLGLNMLRCHIKINDPRYYYWADRLGMLVMYDLPSASIYTPKARANWERTFRDALARDYSHPCIFAWILFNETWGLEEHQTPESWRWVAEMFELAKSLDASRLVEDNSATLYDHVVTDLNTWHFYIADYDRARRHVERVVRQTYEGSGFNFVGNLYHYVEGAATYLQGTQPLLNSEYAGLSARQGDRDVSYTFKFLTGELRRHDMLCGYVYTELTDVEWEHNGFLNYDRTPKEFGYEHFVPGMGVADLNGADFVGLDCPPCQTLPPGSTFRATPFLSHWDRRPLAGARLRWRVSAVDRFGEPQTVAEGERAVAPRRYGVTVVEPIEARLPDELGLVTVAFWLEDETGTVRARNYVNVDVFDPAASLALAPGMVPDEEAFGPGQGPGAGSHTGAQGGTGGGGEGGAALQRRRTPLTPSSGERAGRGYAIRFRPGDFADTSWVTPIVAKGGGKFAAPGAGWVEYTLHLPEGIDREAITGLRLRFEGASRTARFRIGWKDQQRVLSTDYPQTEALKLPSDLVVTINGVQLGRVRLPDDPADARGVLSLHLHEAFEYASYGFLTTLEADGATARRLLAGASPGEGQRGSAGRGPTGGLAGEVTIRFEVPRDARRGGLSLYGGRMGAWPIDPTLFLDL